MKLKEFKKVELSDKEKINKILHKCNFILCDYNFNNLFCWGDIYQIKWYSENDVLFLYTETDDYIFMPCGKIFDFNFLLSLSDEFIKQNKSGNIIFVNQEFINQYEKEIKRYFDIIQDYNNADYIYLSEKLVELKGNKLNKKKNLISQFKRNNPDYKVERLSEEYINDCYKLSEKWCEIKNCNEFGYSHEISALRKALNNFNKLDIYGVLILVKNEIIAFSIFSEQNKETVTIHYEKYNPEIKGAAQIINLETAKLVCEKYKYINREQDLGIEGLRKSKLSYAPEFLIIPYKLLRKR
ncbi:MAG TPA: phosphatidylglycerol lysyltransferase domain-containing protein [bacterium]|nr:phosphatidylglycerol lysyltransferase domain-containing protein [bacterium]HOL46916.1 phosphatidylglycerol lysyltransferase domain-containing protein [bacterium]HPQ18322.1 phosphatidylglycerol lysyltransferase domain-containing protein [bacterium]